MKTTVKTPAKKREAKPKEAGKSVRLSKFGKAMKAGIGRGTIIELTEDPWNLK